MQSDESMCIRKCILSGSLCGTNILFSHKNLQANNLESFDYVNAQFIVYFMLIWLVKSNLTFTVDVSAKSLFQLIYDFF